MIQGVLLYTALAAIALLHGAAAGVRAAAGRDGLLDQRYSEARGALRGMLAVTALLGPFACVTAVDALTSATRRGTYIDGAAAMLVIYTPVVAVTVVAFVLARVARWEVRSFVNSVVIGGLEFARPAVALAGVAAAVAVTRSPGLGALGFAAIVAGLQASRLVSRAWYAAPPALPTEIRTSCTV